MVNKPLLSFLGLAKRAGKLNFGMSASISFAKYNLAKLVLVCFDLSESSFRKLKNELLKYNLEPVKIKLCMNDIEEVFKKKSGIITITDENFASKIISIIKL